MRFLCSILCIFFSPLSPAEPRLWAKVDSECGNDKQSPINILTRQVTYNESLKAFNFINYNVKSNGKWTMENNGHTVIVQLDPSGKVELGGLNGRYKVVQFHFHWGSEVGKTQSPGSEHSIDGERYPMELHIVHIKEEFGNIESASEEKGVAVLGFFIKVWNRFEFHFIFFYQTSKLRTNSLGPKDLTNFYRYTGSLTTPGCNEEVVWTLFEKPIELGGEQDPDGAMLFRALSTLQIPWSQVFSCGFIFVSVVFCLYVLDNAVGFERLLTSLNAGREQEGRKRKGLCVCVKERENGEGKGGREGGKEGREGGKERKGKEKEGRKEGGKKE
uniref:Carbonic anhydrase n=1 Tax=Pseudonaja textilis TaxID=8673 RepID=A0A670Z1T1_PSETE